MYAWIIDTDHLADGPEYDDTGVMGPRQAPDAMTDALRNREPVPNAETFTFRMYDDDGTLYYTGRMATTEGDTERACYGPLGDFGMPNAGAVLIEYNGHPEMACN